MKSNTKIEKQLEKKTNLELVQTVRVAKKNKNWFKIAEILSGPRKKRINLNIGKIEKQAKEKDIIVVPGKVLAQGSVTKKIKIVGLNFSEKAKENLLKAGCEISSISDEIKKNPEAKGIKILKK